MKYMLLFPEDSKPSIVCVQWFDKTDYDEKALLPLEFETEEEAELWLHRIYSSINRRY